MSYQDIPEEPDFEAPHSPVPSAKPVYSNKGTSSVLVSAKLRNRYRQFEVPSDVPMHQLSATIKEKFDMFDEVGASVGVAYMLWLVFGFFGIHRFYLKQHNATSWAIWFFTGQLFFVGWVYDGFVLRQNVAKYNSRSVYRQPTDTSESSIYELLFGFKEDARPSMVAAYLLWFFFGGFGIHRWYTGYHTTSSFLAWFCSFQIWGIGWVYDGYYTAHMVNYPKLVSNNIPFYLKVHKKYDYMPVNSDEDLSTAVHNAFVSPERTLRLLVVEKKREDLAYLLWFIFGIIGGHAWYLDMELKWVRFFTGNFFFFGLIADGIRLSDEIARANLKIAGDFVPSLEGSKVWPQPFGSVGVVSDPSLAFQQV